MTAKKQNFIIKVFSRNDSSSFLLIRLLLSDERKQLSV